MTIRQRLRAFVLASFFAFLALFAVGGIASAADSPLVVEGAGEFVITKPVWTILTGLLLPILVGFVTKASANSSLKAVVGIIVAAVAATVERATLTDGTAVFTGALVLDIALVYLPQIASYYGLWKNVNLNAKLAPNSGIG